MTNNASTNVVERSYQLARSGTCASVPDIRVRLKAEGYDNAAAHLGSPTLKSALTKLCREAHGKPGSTEPVQTRAGSEV